MGSAWWHEEEGLILLDARKPNFKKTDFGVLPIDLILAELTSEMRERFIRATALPNSSTLPRPSLRPATVRKRGAG
jgi:hypothetical protein